MKNNDLLATYVSETLEFIKGNKDLAFKEANLYIKEILEIELYLAMLGALIGFILLLLSLFTWIFLDTNHTIDVNIVLKTLASGSLLLFGSIYLFHGIANIIRVKVSPRVVIMDKLSELIRE